MYSVPTSFTVHTIPFYFIALIYSRKQANLWSFSTFNFLCAAVAPNFFGPNSVSHGVLHHLFMLPRNASQEILRLGKSVTPL
jgi:hypothetical protein